MSKQAAAVNCFGVWTAEPVPEEQIATVYSIFGEPVPMQMTKGSPEDVQQWIDGAKDECAAFQAHIRAWIRARAQLCDDYSDTPSTAGRHAFLVTLRRVAGQQ